MGWGGGLGGRGRRTALICKAREQGGGLSALGAKIEDRFPGARAFGINAWAALLAGVRNLQAPHELMVPLGSYSRPIISLGRCVTLFASDPCSSPMPALGAEIECALTRSGSTLGRCCLWG